MVSTHLTASPGRVKPEIPTVIYNLFTNMSLPSDRMAKVNIFFLLEAPHLPATEVEGPYQASKGIAIDHQTKQRMLLSSSMI